MFSLLRKSVKSPAPKKTAPSQRTVEVAGRHVPITVRENPRATRITLRIEPGGRALKLTIPQGLHHRQVDDFLERHQGWLEGKLLKIGPDDGLGHGATIDIRGISHRIDHTGSLRGLTHISQDADGTAVLKVSGAPEHLRRRVATFLKKEAKA
ncbi:MAG: YgjP-like metallopeptidase domain-containing protein, partial [Rhizobium oryzihabitans]